MHLIIFQRVFFLDFHFRHTFYCTKWMRNQTKELLSQCDIVTLDSLELSPFDQEQNQVELPLQFVIKFFRLKFGFTRYF